MSSKVPPREMPLMKPSAALDFALKPLIRQEEHVERGKKRWMPSTKLKSSPSFSSSSGSRGKQKQQQQKPYVSKAMMYCSTDELRRLEQAEEQVKYLEEELKSFLDEMYTIASVCSSVRNRQVLS